VQPFIADALQPETAGERTIDIEDLIRFLKNPAEQFLKQRLKVYFDSGEETIGDDEAFALDTLEAYALKQDLLETQMAAGSIRGEYERVKASGALPHGAAGRAAFERICEAVETFATQVAGEMRGPRLADAEIDVQLDGLRVTGTIGNVYGEALLFYRMAGMKAKDYLAGWVGHLLLQAAALPGYPGTTVCCAHTKDKPVTKTFASVADPLAVLNDLARLYLQGMRAPLPFYPDTSKKYIEAVRKGKTGEEAVDEARGTWSSSYSGAPTESENLYIAQCIGEADPFTEEFAELAVRVYTPLLDSCEAAEADAHA